MKNEQMKTKTNEQMKTRYFSPWTDERGVRDLDTDLGINQRHL